MPDQQLFTQQAATRKATIIQGGLAASKLRLVKNPITLNQFTTKEVLEANEADYDGYPAGGYPMATWLAPNNDPGGGSVITSPLVNVAFGTPSDPPIGNVLYGWWLEDSTGSVRLVGIWNPERPIQAPGDGFPFVCQIVEGRNPSQLV